MTLNREKGMLELREGIMNIEVSSTLKKLTDLFPCDLFIVGGHVRNCLLGIEQDIQNDVDIVSELTLDEVAKILNKTSFDFKVKSRNLGTAIITYNEERFEYSTFRRELYNESGQHTPERVEFITDVTEDAKRRDFTINCIYYNLKTDELHDVYHGIDDLKKKVLRTVETPEFVLSKDGARILRLFRFQCELGFKIEKETLQAAIKYADNVRDISSERRVTEIIKILHSFKKYTTSKPNAFMRAFRIFNKYQLWSTFGMDVPKIKFNMVKKVEHKSQGFLIDLIDTVNPVSVSYYLEGTLTEIGIPKKQMQQLINVLSGYYSALNKESNKSYFFKYFDNFPIIYLLISKKSKILAMKYEFFYKYIISHKLVISVKDLKINGDDIKKYYPHVSPKRYRAILESLLSDVFDCKILNDKKDLIEAVNLKLKYL